MKEKISVSIDEGVTQALEKFKVDNISDLVNVLLKAWLQAVKEEGRGKVIEKVISKVDLYVILEKLYNQTKEAIENAEYTM